MAHSVVTAAQGEVPEPFQAVRSFPRLGGRPGLGRLQKIARALMPYDLVCTWDYWAMNAAMAQTAFSQAHNLPPLIHHELENVAKSLKANWYRRIALGKSVGVVVPDERLEEAALVAWQQPFGRVKLIRDGIDLGMFADPPPADMLGSLLKRPGESWVGAVTRFMPQERLQEVLGAFASLTENWHLVLFDAIEPDREGKAMVRSEAKRLEIAHRVHLPGEPDEAGKAMGLFDIALVPPGGRDTSLPAIRAMAAGVALIADNGTSAASLLPEESEEFALSYADAEELALALGTLAADPALAEATGHANRVQAQRNHDKKAMLDSHRRLYSSALKLR